MFVCLQRVFASTVSANASCVRVLCRLHNSQHCVIFVVNDPFEEQALLRGKKIAQLTSWEAKNVLVVCCVSLARSHVQVETHRLCGWNSAQPSSQTVQSGKKIMTGQSRDKGENGKRLSSTLSNISSRTFSRPKHHFSSFGDIAVRAENTMDVAAPPKRVRENDERRSPGKRARPMKRVTFAIELERVHCIRQSRLHYPRFSCPAEEAAYERAEKLCLPSEGLEAEPRHSNNPTSCISRDKRKVDSPRSILVHRRETLNSSSVLDEDLPPDLFSLEPSLVCSQTLLLSPSTPEDLEDEFGPSFALVCSQSSEEGLGMPMMEIFGL
eukprot:g40503.t1